MTTLKKIADEFEITLDDLLDGRFDQEWIRSPKLSETFRAENGSRLRTSLAVLRWMENQYGRQSSRNLTRALRIPLATLENPDQPVRLRLLASLLRAASARGVSNASLFQIGASALDIPENEKILNRLASLRDPRELYDFFFSEMIEKFESNFHYKLLKYKAGEIEFQVTPQESRISENGIETITDRALTAYRCGVSAGLLKSIGVKAAQAKLLKSASVDSLSEVVRITWDKPQAAFDSSRRLRLVETSSIVR